MKKVIPPNSPTFLRVFCWSQKKNGHRVNILKLPQGKKFRLFCTVMGSLKSEIFVWGRRPPPCLRSCSNLGPVKSDKVLPTARHRCNISSKGSVLPAGAMTQRWAPQTRYTLRRNTASIMKERKKANIR